VHIKLNISVFIHKPRMCSVCRNHNPVLSSFMSYHRVCSKSKTTGSTFEQELKTLPKHLNSLPVFRGVHVAQSLVFCVMFCRLLFILLSFFSVILLSVLLWLRFLINPFAFSHFSFNRHMLWSICIQWLNKKKKVPHCPNSSKFQ
jgi:hypothetical protein